MGTSLQATDIPSTRQVFIPQETLDEPFDVTLVVEDGNEFKAHRRVLSEASPFFEKLLNSDMRESNEGVVRLEMLSELGLRDILEFMYTGNIQISAEDNAQDLIARADYFDLPHLKILAGRVLVQELTVLNCISTYTFAKRYQCEELIRDIKEFIFSNFTTVAKTEEFLDLSSQEVKMLISSDEINVTAEEDVFNIILKWIGHEKDNRKKYFSDLIRKVRLNHVSREFLCRDIMTNDLVKDNKGCMGLVKEAMKLIDSGNYHHLNVPPRRWLETPALVVRMNEYDNQKYHTLCYHPREETWSWFRGIVPPDKTGEVISCHGKYYFISQRGHTLLRYTFFSNSWVPLPNEEQKGFRQAFVAKNEIYALGSERSCLECISLQHETDQLGVPACASFKRHHSWITKYKTASNSWEEITSFDLGWREGICIVAKDDFVYFLGGSTVDWTACPDAGRYDLSTNTWDRIDDLKKPRRFPYGAAAYGKIFIAGGEMSSNPSITCEVYDELTNEWQLIAPISRLLFHPTLICVDDRLFALLRCNDSGFQECRVVNCYDPNSDQWKEHTQIPIGMLSKKRSKPYEREYSTTVCSMRVFKSPNDSRSMRKCSIM